MDGSVDLDELAVRTQGYSGSDLKEMCRAAVMLPLRDMIPVREDKSLSALDVGALQADSLRPVAMDDFRTAMDRIKPADQAARDYLRWAGTHADTASTPPAFVKAALDALATSMLQAVQLFSPSSHGNACHRPGDDDAGSNDATFAKEKA